MDSKENFTVLEFDPSDTAAHTAQIEAARKAIAKLSNDEMSIVLAIFIGKPDENGMSQQTITAIGTINELKAASVCLFSELSKQLR